LISRGRQNSNKYTVKQNMSLSLTRSKRKVMMIGTFEEESNDDIKVNCTSNVAGIHENSYTTSLKNKKQTKSIHKNPNTQKG
jgi:hypothetical protein